MTTISIHLFKGINSWLYKKLRSKVCNWVYGTWYTHKYVREKVSMGQITLFRAPIPFNARTYPYEYCEVT